MKTVFTLLMTCASAVAQTIFYETNVVVQPFVGSSFYGHIDGEGELTMFTAPRGICAIGGTLFVADQERIRAATTNGTVSTLAGGGTGTGCGTNVNLSTEFLCADVFGNVYSMQYASGTVRRFTTPLGCVSNISLGVTALGIACDGTNLFIGGTDNKIWRYSPTTGMAVFVGSGNAGTNDGNGIFCSFYSPKPIACDSIGNVYVFDSSSGLIRQITPQKIVSTVTGRAYAGGSSDGPRGSASIDTCNGGAVDSNGNIYISTQTRLRKITPDGYVTTVAGAAPSGYQNGSGSVARFNGINGIFVFGQDIYVSDTSNYRVRKITQPFEVSVSPASISSSTYAGLTISGLPGRNYRIESSADSVNWTPSATFKLPSNPYLWIDTNAIPNNPRKFYRAVLLP